MKARAGTCRGRPPSGSALWLHWASHWALCRTLWWCWCRRSALAVEASGWPHGRLMGGWRACGQDWGASAGRASVGVSLLVWSLWQGFGGLPGKTLSPVALATARDAPLALWRHHLHMHGSLSSVKVRARFSARSAHTDEPSKLLS